MSEIETTKITKFTKQSILNSHLRALRVFVVKDLGLMVDSWRSGGLNIFYSTQAALDSKITGILRVVDEIQTHSRPVIEHCCREFDLSSLPDGAPAESVRALHDALLDNYETGN